MKKAKRKPSHGSSAAAAETAAGLGLGSFVACYNPACADYRRRREPTEPCACKKTSVRDSLVMRDYEF